MSSESLASSFSTFRESSSLPEVSRTCAQCTSLPASIYADPDSVHDHLRPSLAGLPSEDPADGSLRSDFFSPISIQRWGSPEGAEGRFLESHRAAGILKPSSAPLGIIQNTYLDDAYKAAVLEVKQLEDE